MPGQELSWGVCVCLPSVQMMLKGGSKSVREEPQQTAVQMRGHPCAIRDEVIAVVACGGAGRGRRAKEQGAVETVSTERV